MSEKRRTYGRLSSEEKRASKEEKRASKEPDNSGVPTVPEPKPAAKKKKTRAAAKPRPQPPLRTIDLREDDAANIRRLKAQRLGGRSGRGGCK